MCRLLAWAARRPVTVAGALGETELEAFTALSRQHADGWGMAWWPSATDGGPVTERSTSRADGDPRFAELARSATADAGFVHLRWATPGLPIITANTHPFTLDGLAFAHNGAIHPQERLGEIVSPGWLSRVHGTTDSERYFLALAARILDGAPVHDAAAAVVQDIFERFEPTSLNAMLLAPDALYVICAFDPARVPSLAASTASPTAPVAPDTVFYDLHQRVRADSVVVASSGFPQRSDDGWEPLANMTLLRIERGTLATSVSSLTGSTVPVAS
jgi:predicted glutamine amidotransferase